MRKIGFKDHILLIDDKLTPKTLANVYSVLAENFDGVVKRDNCYILIPRNITEVKIDLKKYLDGIDWIDGQDMYQD